MASEKPICEHTGQPMECIFCEHGETHQDCFIWIKAPETMRVWKNMSQEKRDLWKRGQELSKKLLPCPFCGGLAIATIHPIIVKDVKYESVAIGCINHECWGHNTQSGNAMPIGISIARVEENIQKWNRRPKRQRKGASMT